MRPSTKRREAATGEATTHVERVCCAQNVSQSCKRAGRSRVLTFPVSRPFRRLAETDEPLDPGLCRLAVEEGLQPGHLLVHLDDDSLLRLNDTEVEDRRDPKLLQVGPDLRSAQGVEVAFVDDEMVPPPAVGSKGGDDPRNVARLERGLDLVEEGLRQECSHD